MGQKDLIVKDLFKKLEAVKGEHFKVQHQFHEDNMKVYEEQWKILELIRQNVCAVVVDPFAERATKGWVDNYNKEVSGLRASIKKNDLTSAIIEKIPIEDIALVKLSNEHVRDIDYEGKKTDFYYEPHHLVHPYLNSWLLDIQYLHGGPGSPVKVFFRAGGNGHNHICGVLVNEPSKAKTGLPGRGHEREGARKAKANQANA